MSFSATTKQQLLDQNSAVISRYPQYDGQVRGFIPLIR
jgi:hypothetical protein